MERFLGELLFELDERMKDEEYNISNLAMKYLKNREKREIQNFIIRTINQVTAENQERILRKVITDIQQDKEFGFFDESDNINEVLTFLQIYPEAIKGLLNIFPRVIAFLIGSYL